MAKVERSELTRLILLNLAVLLEGAAVLSVVQHIAFLPLGPAYQNIVSVAVFVLPSVIGLLSRRFEVAILLAVLPMWLLALISLALYAPVWTVDAFTLGVQVGRTAGVTVLLGSLGFLGWLLRRIWLGRKATRTQVA